MYNDGYINVLYRNCTVKMYNSILFWYIIVLMQVVHFYVRGVIFVQHTFFFDFYRNMHGLHISTKPNQSVTMSTIDNTFFYPTRHTNTYLKRTGCVVARSGRKPEKKKIWAMFLINQN